MQRRSAGTLTLALLTLLLVAAPSFAAYNDLGYDIEFTELTVYRDGLVHVAQTLSVNETFPSVNLRLLSSSVENMVVVDENDTALDYDTTESNMTVYSLGAKSVTLEYDTNALTGKDAEVWTLILDAPCNLTVYMPEGSTILYVSDIPASIETRDEKLVLSLSPGSWEISYVLSIVPLQPEAPLFPIEYAALIVVLAVACVGVLLWIKRRKPSAAKVFGAHPYLRQEDRDVIQFLEDNGGKAFESEIREKFPNMPRTSLWRLVRRLEKMEIVTVKRIGLQNQVELKK